MVAGSLPARSGRPIGVWMRASVGVRMSFCRKALLEPRHLADEPMRPIEPRCSQRSAASHRAASSAWSWVITSTWVPRGHLAEHQLGHRRVVDVHPGDRVVEDAEPVVAELVGARVDEVQLDVVPGQDAGQLEADVADPEDRHRGHHGERFEQHLHLATAALLAVLGRAPCR